MDRWERPFDRAILNCGEYRLEGNIFVHCKLGGDGLLHFPFQWQLRLSEGQPSLGRLSRELETAIFRIVQECLTNIHRHSGSADAAIHLMRNSRRVVVEVRDRGKGMPVDPTASEPLKSGVGIRGMRERIKQLGGTLSIESSGKGTSVIALFPLEAEEVASEAQTMHSQSGRFPTGS
jgi:signal transduction histidine kinase